MEHDKPKVALTYSTSNFWKTCPHCDAAIKTVQFGGAPDTSIPRRAGDVDYSGFVYVQYECRANYYFDEYVQIMKEHVTRCPKTLRPCETCGRLLNFFVWEGPVDGSQRREPFCDDSCAAKWAQKNYATKTSSAS